MDQRAVVEHFLTKASRERLWGKVQIEEAAGYEELLVGGENQEMEAEADIIGEWVSIAKKDKVISGR
jgi:hypothetical protein